MTRTTISKRLRFEIFKRDGFRCVYCGATPVKKVLRVDHVVPIAEGGTSDPINLITACHDCNAGKGAVRLDDSRLPEDQRIPGNVEALRDQLEQIRAYLEKHDEFEQAQNEAGDEITSRWEKRIGPMSNDMRKRLRWIIRDHPLARLFNAIEITAAKFGQPDADYDWPTARRQQKYFCGVVRQLRMREEKERDAS